MRAIAIPSLVRSLLTQEALPQESPAGAAGRISDKLRAHLSTRIGQEGFRTLLARALTMTRARFPQMSAVRVEANGSLAGLREAAAEDSREDGDGGPRGGIDDGAVALLEHLLGLLVTFVGEDLTLRMIGTVWPGLALSEHTSDGPASDDKTSREKERP